MLDVKCGRGAFMKTVPEAVALAQVLVDIGRRHGVPTEALVTSMERPLGRAVGNALEIREAIEALSGHGPRDLMSVVGALAARVLTLAGRAANSDAAHDAIHAAVTSGAARRTFRDMVEAQGGDCQIVDHPDRLPRATHVGIVVAERAGLVGDIDALAIGRAAAMLGAGRARANEAVDPAAGVRLLVGVGDRVDRGDPVAELHGSTPARVAEVTPAVAMAVVISTDAAPLPLILSRVSTSGEVHPS